VKSKKGDVALNILFPEKKQIRSGKTRKNLLIFTQNHFTAMRKLKVAIVFGGRSAEHEVSLQSALNVIESLDMSQYEPVLIGIDRDGRWFLNENSMHLLHAGDPKLIRLSAGNKEVALTPNGAGSSLISLSSRENIGNVDVIFPVLHGPYGEDGTIQGLARLANLPCVGAGILGSSVGMDKDVMKRLLRDAGIPIGRFETITVSSRNNFTYGGLKNKLGSVLFVKPANLGSSVGISKVRNEAEFVRALDLAFEYDLKVVVEEEIIGREIECAVLGNESPQASVPGEIIPHADFYSYEAKYLDDDGAGLEIPARLSPHLVQQVQEIAVNTFTTLECLGMARVDVFLTPDDRIIVNEINTLPGFTSISMYPKLWKFSGISNTELVDRLIKLALEDYEKRSKLKVSVKL
jgi:D-alanine-D-alanine ligase